MLHLLVQNAADVSTPKIDLTVTITSAIALAAIVSPVLVALINNHYQYKAKQLEIISTQKFSVIEKYLNSAGAVVHRSTSTRLKEYQENKAIIYLYIPRSTWKLVDNLDSQIQNGNLDAARSTLDALSKALSKALDYRD